MEVPIFHSIVKVLVSGGLLKETRNVSAQCSTAMILFFAGQKGPNNRALQERFQCSDETITRHLHAVIDALVAMSPFVITRSDPVPAEIKQSRKFYPYFKDCRGAIDGTHIPVHVPEADSARFMGRKGITMNVLAACSFDLKFTYVLTGWEGAALDSIIMQDAVNRDYPIQDEMYDLGDAGFALTPFMLTPFRNTRYHLKEYLRGTLT